MKNILLKYFWNLQSYTWDDFLISSDYGNEIKDIVDIVTNKSEVKIGKIIDVGCATGSYCIEFAKRGFDVLGVDFASNMIKKGEKKALNLHLNNLSFFLCDLSEKFCLLKNYFDVVLIAHFFHLIENYKNKINEFVELVSDGGLLVLVFKTKRIEQFEPIKINLLKYLIKVLRKLLFSKNKMTKINCDLINNELNKLGLDLIKEAETTNNKVLIFRKTK